VLAQGAGGHRRDRNGTVVVLTRRWPVTLLGAAGALTAGVAGNATGEPAISGAGWAALAGIALSLMLHGTGLRIVGILIAVLAVLGVVVVGWGSWAGIALVPVLVAGALMAWAGPKWDRGERRQRQPAKDLWSRMDAGEDPTDV
jgi:hypothetical protein